MMVVQMMNRTRSLLLLALAVLIAVAVAAPSFATSVYSDYIGPNYDWTLIQETSSFGDPEPLFDAPVGSGDSLTFFPPNFSASAAGAGGLDQTGSQLQLRITAKGGATIDELSISEFGDVLLTGAGTAATGTFASMAGFLTILEDTSGPITPIVLNILGVFTPSNLMALPGDAGTTLWTGSAFLDVATLAPNATVAMLSLDNDLTAYSEAGTTAKIQKKVTGGVVISLPEPGSLTLIGFGLLFAACGGRRRRDG